MKVKEVRVDEKEDNSGMRNMYGMMFLDLSDCYCEWKYQQIIILEISMKTVHAIPLTDDKTFHLLSIK